MRAYFSFILVSLSIAILLMLATTERETNKEGEIKIIKCKTIAHQYGRFLVHSIEELADDAIKLGEMIIDKKVDIVELADMSEDIYKFVNKGAKKEVDGYHVFFWCLPISHQIFLQRINERIQKNHGTAPTDHLYCQDVVATIAINKMPDKIVQKIGKTKIVKYLKGNATKAPSLTRMGITACSPNYDVCYSYYLPRVIT